MAELKFMTVTECAAALDGLSFPGWEWEAADSSFWPQPAGTTGMVKGTPICAPKDVHVFAHQEEGEDSAIVWVLVAYAANQTWVQQRRLSSLAEVLNSADQALIGLARRIWAQHAHRRDAREQLAHAVEFQHSLDSSCMWLRSLIPGAGPPELRIYVAGGITHTERARAVRASIGEAGFRLMYDWTEHGSVSGSPPARIRDVANAELRGAMCADLVLALPGGTGTAIEIGAAVAAGVPVVWLRPESERVCSFEYLAGVRTVRLHPKDITPERATWEVTRHFVGDASAGPCPVVEVSDG